MGKTYIETIKYMILADFKVIGLVERPDIIGAIFGQSEGLLGSELDIKELQQNGKIGRIEIEYNHTSGSTSGTFKLPCSVSMVETAIIAASIETVEKVGPCDSTFVIKEIQDTRGVKRRQIKNRAIDLLGRLMQDQIPDTRELMDEIVATFKTKDIISYGPDKLAAGPTLESSKDILIVEGRADVLNLLRYGFTNTIATGGARIPRSLASICKGKNVTIFLDGDHGGDIQQNQLFKVITVSYVARAPDGKEVEELTQKEINQALRKKVKASYVINSKSKNNNSTNHNRRDGIIKKTKFSITSEHKVVPKLFKENRTKVSIFTKEKPIVNDTNEENNSFSNMLSEIPNIERVDVVKSNYNRSSRPINGFSKTSYTDRNSKRNNNFKENNYSKANSFTNKSSVNNVNTKQNVVNVVGAVSNVVKDKKVLVVLKEKPKVINSRIEKAKSISKLKDAKKEIKKLVNNIKANSHNISSKSSESLNLKNNNATESISEKPNVVIKLPKLDSKLKENFRKIVAEIKDKNRSRLLNEKLRRIANSKNKDLELKIKNFKTNKIFAIISSLDLNENLLNYSVEKAVKFVVVKDSKLKANNKINIVTYKDLGL